jgi:hypothetical protein
MDGLLTLLQSIKMEDPSKRKRQVYATAKWKAQNPEKVREQRRRNRERTEPGKPGRPRKITGAPTPT